MSKVNIHPIPNPFNDEVISVFNNHIMTHTEQWSLLPTSITFKNSLDGLATRVWENRSVAAFALQVMSDTFDGKTLQEIASLTDPDEIDFYCKRVSLIMDYLIDNIQFCHYQQACNDPKLKDASYLVKRKEWENNVNINPYFDLISGCRVIANMPKHLIDQLSWNGLNEFVIRPRRLIRLPNKRQ